MRNLFLLCMTLLMSGCIVKSPPTNGKKTEITNKERVYTQSGSVSATAPNNFPKVPFSGYTRFDEDLISFRRTIPNMMSEDVRVTVGSPENLKMSTEKFLIQDFDYDKWAKEVLSRPDIVANMKERGVNYSKKYVDYIGGLRCGTDVESANIAMGVGHKKYYTVCGYYDLAGNKKRIDIFYHYTYTHSGTVREGDDSSSVSSPQAMQRQFKQDIKEIFDSLVIHDMDREKMNKEGLLHTQKYDIQTEANTKNMYE